MIGQYTLIEPMTHIVYKLGKIDEVFKDSGREVEIFFNKDGSYGCISILQTFDAEESSPLDVQQQGRQAILDNFKQYVESTVK